MKFAYQDINFRASTLRLIEVMNDIIEEYQAQGFVLTVRQLYYQLVARDYIENTERSYKKVTSTVNDARMAGLMDWTAIEDRTREFITRPHWTSPADIVRACAQQYHEDMWGNQEARVFVIVEKEALAGVLERVCHKWDVPLLAARGYPSVSVLREFVLGPMVAAAGYGQHVQILHLGDHDPSGIDMTRDLRDRLATFCEAHDVWSWDIDRIALNMPQIEEVKPPENPAKVTDSRFISYQAKFGDKSWELDALTPTYLSRLVEEHITEHIDDVKWAEKKANIDIAKGKLRKAAELLEG